MVGTRLVCRILLQCAVAGNLKIMSTSKVGKSTNKGSRGVTITLTNGQLNSLEFFAVVSNQPLRLTGLDGRLIAYLVPSEDCGQIRKYTLTRLTVNKARKLLLKSFERSATPPMRKTLRSNVVEMR